MSTSGITATTSNTMEASAGMAVSVNGGAYVIVPASSFSANGYKTDIVIGGSNLLNGQYAFNDISAGWNGGAYIQSIAALGSFNVGDQLSLQFVAAWTKARSTRRPNCRLTKSSSMKACSRSMRRISRRKQWRFHRDEPLALWPARGSITWAPAPGAPTAARESWPLAPQQPGDYRHQGTASSS